MREIESVRDSVRETATETESERQSQRDSVRDRVRIIIILGFFMFPTPPSMDIRGWSEVNSLNGPMWSLMWEYLANILYALFIRHFSKTALAIFVVCSAYLSFDIAFNIDIFGFLMHAVSIRGRSS